MKKLLISLVLAFAAHNFCGDIQYCANQVDPAHNYGGSNDTKLFCTCLQGQYEAIADTASQEQLAQKAAIKQAMAICG
jgi:hypothetical protein